jgi:predicted site-specific integrase-resolvase
MCSDSVVKLREWAAREGVHYQTAWRWWRDGKLPVPARQTATGTIVVEVPAAGGVAPGVVVYARVSWHDQRAGLDRRVARVTEWVTGQGLAVAEVVREVGSGLNGKRPKLRRVCRTRLRRWSWWSTGTGWRASAWSTSAPRSPGCAPACTAAAVPGTGRWVR